MLKRIQSAFLKSQTSITDFMPSLNYHVTDEIISCKSNHLCAFIEVQGAPFEALSDNSLANQYENLNTLFSNSSKQSAGNLQIQTYICRRKVEFTGNYKFSGVFMRQFAAKYIQRFNANDYYENRLYIGLTLKYNGSLEDGIHDLRDILDLYLKSLVAFSPKLLTTYKNDNGVVFSTAYEFLSELLNLENPLPGVPVTSSPFSEVAGNSYLHFHHEYLESRGLTGTKYATIYDLKDFPGRSVPGILNSSALTFPGELTLVQTFLGVSTAKAIEMIDKQLNQLSSVDDKAGHQHEELHVVQGLVASGEATLGSYEGTLIVYGDTAQTAISNGTTARTTFINESGTDFAKSTGSAPASFFKQFPLASIKVRPLVKTTKNLAATFPIHDFSRGRAHGNPLGDGTALIPVETMAKGIYHLNLHYTKPGSKQVNPGAIPGHTLIMGATGTGKTTLQSSILAFAERFNPRYFVLDKDFGSELFVRGLGGDYFALAEGLPTGINPFGFAYSPSHPDDMTPQGIQANKDAADLRAFLYSLVTECARNSEGRITAQEENQIKAAVDTVMTLPYEHRQFSRLLEAIPEEDGDSLYARLSRWCSVTDGRYAWVLDNPVNQFNPATFSTVGFDMTDILKPNYAPTAPLLSCLLYMKRTMQKKQGLLFTIIEEFWLPLKYEITREQILEILKVGRRRLETLVLVSQSPEDAIKSEIFPTIVQQTPTKILLPNPDAEYKNADGGGYSRLNVTEEEFRRYSKLGTQSRTFLIKQGASQSSFGKIDLYGFDEYIPILSSDKDTVNLVNIIIKQIQDKTGIEKVTPEHWLPYFFEAIRNRRKTA